eukprot:g2594.t1
MDFGKSGNAAFRADKFSEAIELYGKALKETESSEDRAKYLSNRCAAYLCEGNGKAALRDAERCCNIRPKWAKSWSRKGAALFLLGRFARAAIAYQNGLALDPESVTLKFGLSESRDASRDMQRIGGFSALEDVEGSAGVENEDRNDDDNLDEDDQVMAFMNEIEDIDKNGAERSASGSDAASKKEEPRSVDDAEIDALDSTGHINRLLQKNFVWKNLNPFHVLLLPTHATSADIKRRYHKLSALVHPDKSTDPRARDAFLEVKKAYLELINPTRRNNAVGLIREAGRVVRERRKKNAEEISPADAQKEVEREIFKVFAQAEQRRRLAKRVTVSHIERNRVKEKEEEERQERETREEEEWRSGRDKRMRSWRDFQTGAATKKRAKLRGFDLKLPDVVAESKPSGAGLYKGKNEDYKKKWR